MRKFITITALIFMMGVIFYMSAQPAGVSSGMSDSVCRHICRLLVPGYEELAPSAQQAMIDDIVFWIRKAAHFTEYFVLGILMYLTAEFYIKSSTKVWWTSLTAGVLYAVTDEIHQSFVPGRSCELRDVMIDGAGVLTSVVIMRLLRKRQIRTKS